MWRDLYGGLGGIALVIGVAAVVALGGYILYDVRTPTFDTRRRELVGQVGTERDGAIRRLWEHEARYRAASSQEQRDAIRRAVMDELRGFPERDLPADVQAFVDAVQPEIGTTSAPK